MVHRNYLVFEDLHGHNLGRAPDGLDQGQRLHVPKRHHVVCRRRCDQDIVCVEFHLEPNSEARVSI